MQHMKPVIFYVAIYKFRWKFLFMYDFYQKPEGKGWPTLRNILFYLTILPRISVGIASAGFLVTISQLADTLLPPTRVIILPTVHCSSPVVVHTLEF